MKVVPFQPEHFWALQVQPSQGYVRDLVSPAEIEQLAAMKSFACLNGEEVLACFGWVELYEHRASVWAYISRNSGPHLLGMTRIAKRLISGLPHRRVEMEVDCGFEQGHRWARMLGFTLEAECLRGLRMDGGDSAIYARIQ